jgi:hypothetical protein
MALQKRMSGIINNFNKVIIFYNFVIFYKFVILLKN